jgi:hypothetical protein
LDTPATLGPVTVEVKWTGPARCQWVTPGEEAQSLDARPEGDRLKIVVPYLESYGQLMIGAA